MKLSMKICFFSPYFPKHFGGGEKHLLDVALAASAHHQVSIAVPSNETTSTDDVEYLAAIQKKYEQFFGESLSNLSFIPSPLGTTASAITKLFWTKKYDAIYYVTDGSLFFSLAPHNYLHIQVPFTRPLSISNKLKLSNWHSINTNSSFTKQVIEKTWGVAVDTVLHPMVNIEELKTIPTVNKQKIILNVGRFFRQLHAKRQDVLIEAYKNLVSQNNKFKDWKLVLVGGVEDAAYFTELTNAARGYNIELITDASRQDLLKLYQRATFYWHATGYQVDELTHPEAVEHFGITTIEAMAAQVVPLVVAKGGQKEVLGTLYPELAWESIEECVAKTQQLVDNKTQLEVLQKQVTQQAQSFSKSVFVQHVEKLFTV